MRSNRRYLLFTFILFLIVFPFVYIVLAYNKSFDILCNGLEYQPYLSTRIYDINGELISELFEENREVADISRVPTHVKEAFLAAEDQNFYMHSGIDLPGIFRALAVDIFSGDFRQGGSTITQQLVKQLYTKGERTVRRKIIEIFLAREFEKKYSKDKILEMYLNQIYFGHGVYGISSASRFYFNHEIDKLSITEASLLAAIPSAPNRNSPLKNPRLAFEKNKQVIFNMINSGYIKKSEIVDQFNSFWARYLEASKTRYQTCGVRNKIFDKAPYFTEYIRRILIEKYGEQRVYRNGLKVYTTLDLRQQKIARDFLLEGIERQNSIAAIYNRNRLKNIDRIMVKKTISNKKIKGRELKRESRFLRTFRNDSIDDVLVMSMVFGIPEIETLLNKQIEVYENLRLSSRVEGAIVALDPRNGGITAMVGGSDFNAANQLNRAVQSLRQPGSAFKAFVYGAGIESKKITAATEFLDVPILFKGTRTIWKPSNYEKSFRGKVLVRQAFAASLNIISVLVLEKVGAKEVAEFASKLMGIPLRRFNINPTLSLGTTELSPLEMARGFAVYANNGREVKPYSIRYIIDKDNKRIYAGERTGGNKGKQLISPQAAFIMTSLMRGVVDYGTASGAVRRGAGFRLPAAGKTGTNTNFRDAWFVGFTPDLVAAVWMGCDSQKFTLGRGQSAASVSAPVWGNFMREVYKFRKPSRFKSCPRGVRKYNVCSKTGKIPLPDCPARGEYFISGTKPEEKCNSEHDEMISIFDLIRKRKNELLEKERLKESSSAEGAAL